MNWDFLESNWKQLTGEVKEKLGKLKNRRVDVVEGKRIHLACRMQAQYGVTQEEAEQQIKNFERNF